MALDVYTWLTWPRLTVQRLPQPLIVVLDFSDRLWPYFADAIHHRMAIRGNGGNNANAGACKVNLRTGIGKVGHEKVFVGAARLA